MDGDDARETVRPVDGSTAYAGGPLVESPDTLKERMRNAVEAEEALIISTALELIDEKASRSSGKSRSGGKAAKVASVTTEEVTARFIALAADRVSPGDVQELVLNALLDSREVDGISGGHAEVQWVRNVAAHRRPRGSASKASPGSAGPTPDSASQGRGALDASPTSITAFDDFWDSVTHSVERFNATTTPVAASGSAIAGHYVLTSGNFPTPLHRTPIESLPTRPSPQAVEDSHPSLRRSGRKRPAAV